MDICWLCNERESSTSEHIIKASTFKLVYPDSQSNPPKIHQKRKLIINGNEKELEYAKKVKSPLSKHLKPVKNLCEKCNGYFTQSYDKEYEKFFHYLHRNQLDIARKRKLDFKRIGINEQLVFKYFVKSFCCTLESTKIIDGLPTLTVPISLINCLHNKPYNRTDLIIQLFSNGKPKICPFSRYILRTDAEYCKFKDGSYYFIFSEAYGWLEILYIYQNFKHIKEVKKALKDFSNYWHGNNGVICLQDGHKDQKRFESNLKNNE